MTLPVMSEYALQKGIDILTASDFTHPTWYQEIREQLEEAGEGVYKLRGESRELRNDKEVLFLLSTEISSIYKQGDKLRRIHNLIFVPNFEAVQRLNRELIKRGCNLSADGRPIVGLSSRNLLELILSIDERSMIIPCHVWTPHFGVYGSASGFDSLEEAYGDLAKYVYGIETGISSDPAMNWQVRELMNRSILSFSDAHSAPKMGREATVFELEAPTYENIRSAIMRPGSQKRDERTNKLTMNKIAYTLEFYPEEGKYHFSGHRKCKFMQGPEETRRDGNICPVCNRRLTEGVLYRLRQLSDETLLNRVGEKITEGVRWFADKDDLQPPFMKLVPLLEIVAKGLGTTVLSQKAQGIFSHLCLELGDEITVLLKTSLKDVARIGGENIAQALEKVRLGDISIDPGYDGEYGKVKIFSEGTLQMARENKGQLKMDL